MATSRQRSLRPVLATVVVLLHGVAAEVPVSRLVGGSACDPFNEGHCEVPGNSLMQKTVDKVEGTTKTKEGVTIISDAAENDVKDVGMLQTVQTEAKQAKRVAYQTPKPYSGHLKEGGNVGLIVRNRTVSKETKSQMAGSKVSKDEHDLILQRNGYFLGFSRDFWILLGIMLGGILASMGLILASVNKAVEWRAEWKGRDIPVTADGSIEKPVFPVGFGQRMFGHDKNSNFAYRADLSLRCAVVSGALALSYWVPALAFLNNYGWSMQYIVVIICFSVYMDIGNTAALAWYNFYGTLLPTINTLLLWGFCENGVTIAGNFSPTWWFGFIDFMVFCGAMLFLQVPVGVRMFALSWQVYFSFCFINPDNTTKFSTGLDDVILQGAAVGPLAGTVIGCVLSILITCPSPWGLTLTGLGQAQEKALYIAWAEGMQWKRMIQYYRGTDRTIEIDRLAGEAKLLEATVQKLDELMASTWWECFDMGKPGRVKAHITELRRKLAPMHDWLKGTIQAMQTEDFNDQHGALMNKVGAEMEQLSDNSAKLMYRAVKMAIDGFSLSSCRGAQAAIAQISHRELKNDIEAVAAAQRDLAKAFCRARGEVYGGNVLTADAVGEHFFVFALSASAQYATEYAEYILSDTRAPSTGIVKASFQGIKDTLAFNSANFIARTCLGFFGACLIGYFGMPGGIMEPFSATAAGTTAYLMAAEGKGGSAVMKNIARFQGTGGGTVIGQLLFTTTMTCAWYGGIIGFHVVTIFEFFAFYLYFSSPSFGYVGLLLAAYGAQHLLVGCSAQETPGSVYNTIVDQTVAIVCVTVGDLLIGNRSSGHLAAEALFCVTNILEDGLKELLGCDTHDVASPKARRTSTFLQTLKTSDLVMQHDKHRDEIEAKWLTAKGIGDEAPLEPRWYRMPFKQDLWTTLLDSGDQIGTKLCVMEYAVIDCEKVRSKHKIGAQSALDVVLSSQTMSEVSDRTMARWNKVFSLSEQLMLHETLAPLNLSRKIKDLMGAGNLEFDTHIDDIVKEICAALPSQEAKHSLIADDCCLAGVLLMMMSGISSIINTMEESCFRDPDVSIDEA